jgi:PAP2 superfamily
MTMSVATAPRRILPRGWLDLLWQLSLWFAFLLAYQVARGIADRNTAKAFENALTVIDIEQKADALVELTFQRWIHSSELLTTLTSWTYWLSQFTVVGLTLLWVYLRRNDAFLRFRNTIMLANVIGLVGYALLPTAPPRFFPGHGFVDTLAAFGTVNHGSGLVELASNPYAAMPSLHAADALIVGVVMATVVRRRIFKVVWLLWPAWVWFTVMGTANHFWLDIVAGIAVAAVAAAVVYRRPLRAFARASA